MRYTVIRSAILGLSVSTLSAYAMGATCNTPWVSTTAYNGGATVSYSSVNYTAAYWTQNQIPANNNGSRMSALSGPPPWALAAR